MIHRQERVVWSIVDREDTKLAYIGKFMHFANSKNDFDKTEWIRSEKSYKPHPICTKE